MALSIVNNSIAIGAQGSVNNANNKLAKTIKSLSTGLRINTAADDASGLAVSEKLRSQISGLSKAATNAQDAISLLQTAEGAMGSMTSMVQRIRELAVQAGDPAYTTNDRAMLQLEVDQLKEEIDRVSTSAEFNTKKLLNGDAAALWSSSSDDLEAIIKGAPAEGNYKFSYSVDPGENSVYKSQIMSLANGNNPARVGAGKSSINTASYRGITLTANGSFNIQRNETVNANTARGIGGDAVTANITINGGTGGYFVEVKNHIVTVRDSMTGSILAKQDIASAGTTTVQIDGLTTLSVTSAAYTQTGAMTITGTNFATNSNTITTTGANTNYGVLAYGLDSGRSYDVAIAKWNATTNSVEYGTLSLELTKMTSTTTVSIMQSDYVDKDTKLSELSQFTNSDGRMILDNTQELTIYAGNGQKVSIHIEANNTISDLETKLATALNDLGLGSNPNTVKYVTAPTGSTSNAAVPGTFIIQGAVVGKDSDLTFVGDQSLLSALGIQQIQQSKESNVTVTVTDAHTGRTIGTDTVSDGRIRNIIDGVEVDIKPSKAYDVAFNTATYTMDFTATQMAESFLHIKDNATKAAIGANEGQTLDISIGRLDTKSMGIDGVNVATFDDAQKAITKLDMALEQISKARATAGAQMNRLEYTINNLNTTRENMVSAESRIRDLDIAQASSDLTAQQVVLQSATAMLAQANQIPSYAAQLLQA